MKVRLKINGIIVFVALMVVALFPTFLFRSAGTGILDELAEIIGIAFILLGQILRVSARGYKSEQSQNGFALVKDGPYTLVRNPMYLGILFIGLGIVLVLFKWWVAVIFLFIFTLRYIFLIFQEEKKLLKAFSGEYRDYMQRVPRILPSLRILLEKDICEYLPLKVSWLKKEIGPIFAVLFVTLLIESWKDIRNEGVRAYFKEALAIIIAIALFIVIVVYLSKRTNNCRKKCFG